MGVILGITAILGIIGTVASIGMGVYSINLSKQQFDKSQSMAEEQFIKSTEMAEDQYKRSIMASNAMAEQQRIQNIKDQDEFMDKQIHNERSIRFGSNAGSRI